MKDDELMHYGVLGMKWGHRKEPIRKGTGRGRNRKSTGYTPEQKAKILKNPRKLKKYYKEFSEEEVRNAIKNLNTEMQLENMHQQQITNGKKTVFTILGIAATGVGLAAVGTTLGRKYSPTLRTVEGQGFALGKGPLKKEFGNQILRMRMSDIASDVTGNVKSAFDDLLKTTKNIK
jgi:hypothetical protein